MKKMFRKTCLALFGTAFYGSFLLACPPVPVVPTVVTAPDGAVVTVTAQTACANLNAQCGADQESCVANVSSLTGGSPLDLGCMTSAKTQAEAAACIGVGALCPTLAP